HPQAVAEGDAERVEVVAPHRARQRAPGIAQLEIDARATCPEPPHLTDDLDPCELEQATLELCRMGADLIRAREGTLEVSLGGCGSEFGHRRTARLPTGVVGPTRVAHAISGGCRTVRGGIGRIARHGLREVSWTFAEIHKE